MSAAIACAQCGWSGSYSSAAKAEYSHSRHSCEKQRRDVARAGRVAARLAASGPVRECVCPVAVHEHGSHAAYVERLQAQGMGWKRVAEQAGVHTGVVSKLLYGCPQRGMGPSKRIRPDTETKILVVTLDRAPGSPVDGTDTRRRLRTLVAGGWSQSKLGARLGINPGNMNTLIHGRQGAEVTTGTDHKVKALYDDLCATPPPTSTRWDKVAAGRAISTAARHGWPPPKATAPAYKPQDRQAHLQEMNQRIMQARRDAKARPIRATSKVAS